MLVHDYYRSDEYDNNSSSIMTFAILYSLNTVPSVDSSISVTIQPVITRNMLTLLTRWAYLYAPTRLPVYAAGIYICL